MPVLDRMVQSEKDLMNRLCLALLISVRCGNQEAVTQILRKLYHDFEEAAVKPVINRTIYLMSPKERDWMKSLY